MYRQRDDMYRQRDVIYRQREDKYRHIIQNINSSRKIDKDKDRYINYNLCEWDDGNGQCSII